MGKRIPKSRKHKKLKFVDPCYNGQGPRINKKLLSNEPPIEDDNQDVPHRLTKVIKLKNKVKAGKLKRKKKKKIIKDDFIVVRNNIVEGDTQGATRPVKNLPAVVKQNEFESEQNFLSRIQRMADIAIAEAKMEEKYGIEIVSVDEKGNAKYKPAPKEISERKREKRKNYNEREKEKKKLKLDEPDFDLHKEKIDFIDVAMAPPVFTAKPRKAPAIDKPGKRELFLKNILEADKTKDKKNDCKPSTTKLKNMPPEKRKVFEQERIRAVQMYRLLKNKKSNVCVNK